MMKRYRKRPITITSSGMTRKDFVSIARALVAVKCLMTNADMQRAWSLCAQSLAREFKRENARFDIKKFKQSLTVIYDLNQDIGFDAERLNVTVKKTMEFKRGKPERMKEETPQTPQQTPNTLK